MKEKKEPLPNVEIVKAITANNAIQAHAWEQALHDADIPCKVVGDYLGAGIGDLPGVPAEIWVAKNDLERAEEVLEKIGAYPTEHEVAE
jgi:hypothetical protein